MRRMRCIEAALAGLLAIACEPSQAQAPVDAPSIPTSEPAPASVALPRAETPEPVPTLPRAGEIFYLERLLGTADPDAPLPMIVAIHGLGDTPENFSHLFDAFTEPARLILPQGLEATPGGGWSWFPLRARHPDVQALSDGIARAADELAVALAELQKARPTLGKPIVTGFSQGGMLTFTLAVRHPDLVAVAVPVGGWLPPPLWPERKPEHAPPVFALHGTADPAVAYGSTLASVEHLQKLGLEAVLRSYEGVQHVITPEIRRDLEDRLVDATRAATEG